MLKTIHLCAGYGALQVLDGISLHVDAGEVVVLAGSNGSGKSTLLKTIAGLISPTDGRMLFHGNEMGRLPAHRVASLGCVLVPEGRGLFPNMSILDNLRMGGYAKRLPAAEIQKQIGPGVCDLFPALKERFPERAGNLSGGQQQMLAIARALVGSPELLLLDEPSTGLAPKMVAEIFKTIESLKKGGTAIMLAEQNVSEALRIADRAYILKTGRIVLDGKASALAQSDEVRKAYLGME